MPSLTHTDSSVKTPSDLPSSLTWVPAVIPGGVHESLLAAELAPHPFVDEHEDDVRWIEDRTWWYRLPLAGPPAIDPSQRVILELPSVDTVATIWFNGVGLGSHANAFRPFVADVSSLVAANNEVVVRIAPPLEGLEPPAGPKQTLDVLMTYAGPALAPHPRQLDEHVGILSGDPRLTLRRKPTFSWGWDFGVRLPSIGILEEPRLVTHTGPLIAGCHVRTIAVEDGVAQVAVDVEVDPFRTSGDLTADIVLTAPDGTEISAAVTIGPSRHGSTVIRIPEAQLWWTHDLGEPALYTVTIALRSGGDATSFRVGLRTVELDRSPDLEEGGRFFRLLLNGVPVFARGSNWVPASALRGSVTPERVRGLVVLARDGGQNMLRIWGGGAYEQDVFYDSCDELGILVWQDFMFACFDYPSEDAELQQEVALEAAFQVSRLRNHASLALWCGNNEIHVLHESLRQTLAPGDWGWHFFHAILPDAVQRHSPGAIYWPGSPWGQDDPGGVNGPEDGDRHFWAVWHGMNATPQMTPAESNHWKRFLEDDGGFASEFGIQALPEAATLSRWLTEPFGIDSRTFQRRIKDVPKSRGRHLIEHEAGVALSLDEYVEMSMACQAEGLKFGVEHYRRRQPHCNGALVWQLNDVWPGVSWSVLDYDLVPKAGYYFLQRAYQPVIASFSQTPTGVELWVSNSGAEARSVDLAVQICGFDGKVFVDEPVRHLAEPGASARVWSSTQVAADRLAWVSDPSGEIPANRTFFGQLKELPLGQGDLSATLMDATTVRLRSDGFSYFSRVVADRPGIGFSTNYVDLRDGEHVDIRVSGLPIDKAPDEVLTAMSWGARVHEWT